MKKNQSQIMKFKASFVAAACFYAFLISSIAPRAVADDAPTNAPAPKVVATLIFPGTNEACEGLARIADVMKYKSAFQGICEILKAKNSGSIADPTQPFGVAIATDGDKVAAFGFIRLADPETFDDSALEAFKTSLAENNGNNPLFKSFKGDFFLVNGLLFVGDPKLKDFYSSIPEDEYSIPVAENGTTRLIDFQVKVDGLPKELAEAGAAVLRQQLAKIVGGADEDKIKEIDRALNEYSNLVNSISQLRWTLGIDVNANLVVESSITAADESELADIFEKTAQAQTRWNVVKETSDSVVATAEAGVARQLAQGNADVARKTIRDNLLNSLDVLIDDPKNLDVAKEIVAHVEDAMVAGLQSGVYDRGVAVSANPLTVVVGASSSSSDSLKKAGNILLDNLKENNQAFADAVVSEKIEGYDVVSLAVSKLDSEKKAPPFFDGASPTVKIGASNDAVLIVASIDGERAASEFQRVAKGSTELAPQTNERVFDVSRLAAVVQAALSKCDNVRPVAAQSVDCFIEAENAKIVSSRRFEGRLLASKTTITSGVFKALGDVIRVNMFSRADADEGEDIDGLFDDGQE